MLPGWTQYWDLTCSFAPDHHTNSSVRGDKRRLLREENGTRGRAFIPTIYLIGPRLLTSSPSFIMLMVSISRTCPVGADNRPAKRDEYKSEIGLMMANAERMVVYERESTSRCQDRMWMCSILVFVLLLTISLGLDSPDNYTPACCLNWNQKSKCPILLFIYYICM